MRTTLLPDVTTGESTDFYDQTMTISIDDIVASVQHLPKHASVWTVSQAVDFFIAAILLLSFLMFGIN